MLSLTYIDESGAKIPVDLYVVRPLGYRAAQIGSSSAVERLVYDQGLTGIPMV